MPRSAVLQKQLKRVDGLARRIQEALPGPVPGQADREKHYKGISEVLAPLLPACAYLEQPLPAALAAWAEDCSAILAGASSIALVAANTVERQLALAAVAQALEDRGSGLGHALPLGIGCQGILELARKAPGFIAVPAAKLRMGVNPYEMANAVAIMLSAMADEGRAAIFSGDMAGLRSIFQSGQGTVSDPLNPAVVHVPTAAMPLGLLCRFAVGHAAASGGGLAPRALEALGEEIAQLLGEVSIDEQGRLLPSVAARGVEALRQGAPGRAELLKDFLAQMAERSETLSTLTVSSRARRCSKVTAHYVERICDPQFEKVLRHKIVGQSPAVTETVERLCMEVLSRPDHQPPRIALQGTPGTGKSETAQIVAEVLDAPFVNVDAASFSDPHTAAAALTGAGVGIVGSYRQGRLEEVSKHPSPVVVEVSDLDHAPPAVCASLTDLFLRVLEFGEGQSANGASFSAANCLYFFTLNLPKGADERLRRPMGIHRTVDRDALRETVESELAAITSSAFVSRVGRPVLFAPLGESAQATILERAIDAAAQRTADRLGLPMQSLSLEPGLGRGLLRRRRGTSDGRGARGLYELGRTLAVRAMTDYAAKAGGSFHHHLRVTAGSSGGLAVTPNP